MDGYTVGAAKVIGNLAVFPIYASVQEDLGDFVTLEAALERGTAVVRELAPAPPPQATSNPGPGPQAAQVQNDDNVQRNALANQQAYVGDGAQVNTLAIENKGDVPIFVLAGTIVKGGKQDRQIGQDFLVGARQTVPVDAFCIEHGRWTPTRDGAATGGQFTTTKVLANAQVRAAGQYEKDQGQVWSKVGEINKTHKKETASDTLVASVEDAEVVAQRGAIGREVTAFLGGVEAADAVVGLAYAVDGKVRGARWFMNRKLFQQYQETLVNTAALEAVTAQASAKTAGQPVASGASAPESVARFVTEVQTGREEERKTNAENVNAYRYSDQGYGSETIMKAPPAAAGAPTAKPKAITRDFVAK
jgi:hypothetical protein